MWSRVIFRYRTLSNLRVDTSFLLCRELSGTVKFRRSVNWASFITFIYLVTSVYLPVFASACVAVSIIEHARGGQRTTCESQLTSTTWVPSLVALASEPLLGPHCHTLSRFLGCRAKP